MDMLETETIDHGICLIDTYRAPGDLYDSWDIVPQNPDGTFSRKPDASYGPDAYVDEKREFYPVHVTEHYEKWDQNGWTKARTVIRADGQIVASQG